MMGQLRLEQLRKYDLEHNDNVVQELEQLVEGAAFYLPLVINFVQVWSASGMDQAVDGLEASVARGHLKASEMDRIRLKASEIRRRVARGPLVAALRA